MQKHTEYMTIFKSCFKLTEWNKRGPKMIYLKLLSVQSTHDSEKTTSPPSPELDFPPNLFIAMAIAS